MSQERPTFSPFWHRVRATRPRLRPRVQITRHFFRGQRWHVVQDPSTNQFYRLTGVAHEFVVLLDGQRTVEETWHLSLQRHGDEAPTQNEVIQLLSQLYASNLLTVEAAPETEQMLRRGRERLGRKVKQQAIGLMYFKIRLFNPDRYLAWLEPILRPLLNRWGFLAWCALMVAAVVALVPRAEELFAGVQQAVAPSNWIWLSVVWVVLKAIHETGHGIICKRFGGAVPEFGFMLLVLFPAPYVDASSAWTFPQKWRRVAVGAGGMMFELAVAAVAAFVWLNTSPEQLVNQLAYNAMLTASVATVVFNANPLLRFDGYYILSDLIEVPNLMQRSQNQLKHFFQKHVYRVKEAVPPATLAGETAILYVFGVLSLAYRVFLFFVITLYVLGLFFALGLVLAVWTAAMWFILPVGKFVHWLATHHHLADFRPRAIATSLAMIALATGAVGLIPFPDHRRASGVVDSPDQTGVFAGADGFVTVVHARPGQRVRKGDPIVTAVSPEIDAQIRLVDAAVAESEARERAVLERSVAAAQVARARAEALREQGAFFRRKRDALVVRAPHDGVIVGRDPEVLRGVFLREGQPVAMLVEPNALRVAATMSQQEANWLFEERREGVRVEMRRVSSPARVVEGWRVRTVDAGRRDLPHPALGFAGGGTIETAPDDRSGVATTRPTFTVYVEPPADAGIDPVQALGGAPGERVRLRFTLESRPLLQQWMDRLRQALQGKVTL